MRTFSTHTSGPEDAPALVLVHGFMGSAADFAAVTEHLDGGVHCVRVDLPGHGETTLSDRELSLPDLADALRRQVLDDLDRPTVVGYSMGGRLALQTALDHPDAVGELVLVSTSPGIADSAAREQRRAHDRERARRIRADFAAFLDAWYQLPIFGRLAHTPDCQAMGYQAMLQRRLANDPEAMARVIVELSPGRQPSNWHRLDNLDNVRWIVGEDDPKYRALGQRLRSDGHRVAVAPGAAHAVHVEDPAWLAEQLLRG